MTAAPSLEQRLFALEIPDETRLGAVAAEAALRDADLDALEAQLAETEADVGARLGAAFQLARAGRRRSGPVLAAFRREVLQRGLADEGKVLNAALDLLALHPPARLERADRGYRWRDDVTELFIEDPLAEHWHGAGRWGPPIRPDLERPPRFFGPNGDFDELLAFAKDGGVLVVTFRPPAPWRDAAPAVRVTRAGFARDAALTTLVRWADLASLGWMEEGAERAVAYEVRGETERALPPAPACGSDELMRMFEALVAS
jgi:hypothetical protein